MNSVFIIQVSSNDFKSLANRPACLPNVETMAIGKKFHEIERNSFFAEAPRLEQAVEAARAISYSHPFSPPLKPPHTPTLSILSDITDHIHHNIGQPGSGDLTSHLHDRE
ncbi:hypothetical protein J6590_095687 [Homalodisca vitripennis]|nr:hypothetical protein J6590_095687 [Homalodisca vitripennis]